MDKLMKLLDKKKKEGKELNPMHVASKMSMLEALRDEMSGIMKDDLENGKMKKVEVASSDKEGLKQGLDKAKQLVSKMPNGMEEESEEEPMIGDKDGISSEEESEGMPEMSSHLDNMSKEEIDELIMELQRKKAEMK